MSVFEAVAAGVGELLAYVISRVMGKTFHIDDKRAQTMGEYVVLTIMLSAAVIVTLVCS